MAVRRSRFPNTHFTPGEVEVRVEDVTLVDGRTRGQVAVAETPEGSVTEWVPAGTEDEEAATFRSTPKAAKLNAMADALAGEFDVVPFDEIRLRHSTDSHIDGGTTRAVTPYGCVTVWGEPDEATVYTAVKRALRGDLEGDRELESREEAMERYP